MPFIWDWQPGFATPPPLVERGNRELLAVRPGLMVAVGGWNTVVGYRRQLARRTHENVLAEMLEKVLAYNICQIIRLRKEASGVSGK